LMRIITFFWKTFPNIQDYVLDYDMNKYTRF
jgi:hypothetical protein